MGMLDKMKSRGKNQAEESRERMVVVNQTVLFYKDHNGIILLFFTNCGISFFLFFTDVLLAFVAARSR